MRTRVAPAGRRVGPAHRYRWTADGDRLRLTVDVSPEGDWTVPLPRLGVRLGLPAASGHVEWFGGGPGEAYPDTRAAARIGRWDATVDELQTPYVRPQENGARADVRWAVTDGAGRDCGSRATRTSGSPRGAGPPSSWTRRGTPTDLAPGDTVWVNLDHGQHGIGTASPAARACCRTTSCTRPERPGSP